MNSKEISLAGILISITSIILYLTSVIPSNTLTILTVASAITPICIMRSTVKNAILVYIANSIISLFIVPINISLLYIMFFGVYGVVKFFIEKINKIWIEIILKLIVANLAIIILIFLFESIIGINIISNITNIIENISFIDIKNDFNYLGILIIVLQPIFIIYDYALTLIITMYINKIHKRV